MTEPVDNTAIVRTLPQEPALVVARPTLVDPSRTWGAAYPVQVCMVPAVMDKEAYD
ncbi:MAG: hypothetical protein ACREFD_09625 [Stellaceae bacterium]